LEMSEVRRVCLVTSSTGAMTSPAAHVCDMRNEVLRRVESNWKNGRRRRKQQRDCVCVCVCEAIDVRIDRRHLPHSYIGYWL
jgi:hypothetical protein